MNDPKMWRLQMVCCDYDAGEEFFSNWTDADDARGRWINDRLTEPGHHRIGIVTQRHDAHPTKTADPDEGKP